MIARFLRIYLTILTYYYDENYKQPTVYVDVYVRQDAVMKLNPHVNGTTAAKTVLALP